MMKLRKLIDDNACSQSSQKVKSQQRNVSQSSSKASRKNQRRKRDRDNQPSQAILDMLKSLWYEMFIFDQSDGEKLRQLNFKLEIYEDFFKNVRFDDKTP